MLCLLQDARNIILAIPMENLDHSTTTVGPVTISQIKSRQFASGYFTNY